MNAAQWNMFRCIAQEWHAAIVVENTRPGWVGLMEDGVLVDEVSVPLQLPTEQCLRVLHVAVEAMVGRWLFRKAPATLVRFATEAVVSRE